MSEIAGPVRPGRPEAARLIWSWRDLRAREATEVAPARARLRGSLQGAAAAVLGAVLLHFGHATVGRVALGVGAVVFLSAMVAPRTLYAGIERIFQRLGRVTGEALGWFLLVPLFYTFFAPFGLLLRRGRRDRLRRIIDPDAVSYWEPHSGETAASASHRRQY